MIQFIGRRGFFSRFADRFADGNAMIGKFLGLISIGRTAAGAEILRRFLLAAANVLTLAIVGAFMICALLASVFYMVYFGLVQYGVDPQHARALLSIFVLVAALVVMGITVHQRHKLFDLSQAGLPGRGKECPDIVRVVEAFIDGFLNPEK